MRSVVLSVTGTNTAEDIEAYTVQDFAKYLRAARIGRGLTQRQLATRAGATQVRVSNLERGVTDFPKIDEVESLAKALQVSWQWFLTGSNYDTVRTETE